MAAFRATSSVALVAWTIVLGASSLWADSTVEQKQSELDLQIAELIRKLGSEEFATRERAQAELERMGLAAFDALHQAQTHDDIEIAMRAQYLVRSMRVDWAQENDPAEVKKILRGYGSQNEAERKNRMDRLAKLENSSGIGALSRLVRFESSGRLSKQAALLIMNHQPPEDDGARAKLAQTITATVGLSKRSSGEWLKIYARTLVDPEATLEQWEELTSAERTTFAQFPERSSPEILRDLLRWQAGLLLRLGREQQAVAAMRRSIDLLDGTREQLLDMVDWLLDRKAWSVVEEVAERYSARFNEHALLLYRLAESKAQQGQHESAEEIAARALSLLPEEPVLHVETAFELQDRGLFEWAEREYRHVMKLGPTGSLHDVHARLLLSEMLHDVERNLLAAEVLQGAVDVLEKDAAAREVVSSRLGRELGSVKSRMYYFYSRHDVSMGDRKKEGEHLQQGLQADPTDADVLIAMYHVPDADDEWRKTTLQKIDAATGHFRDEIASFEQQAAQAPNEQIQSLINRMLASSYNQFAWLVGNTVGDYDEALRSSKKSLHLRPDTGGYLDTLARCYYAKGDFENAVKYQLRAVEMEPHSQQIRRQLALFQKTLAESKKRAAATEGQPAKKEPNGDP